MSLNIKNEFLNFKKKELIKYSQICLDKFYNKKVFEPLLDEYLNARYNEYRTNFTKSDVINNINEKLNQHALTLEMDKNIININLKFFYYLHNIDSTKDRDKRKKIIDKINAFRINKLNIEEIEENIYDLITDNKNII